PGRLGPVAPGSGRPGRGAAGPGSGWRRAAPRRARAPGTGRRRRSWRTGSSCASAGFPCWA
ncbi:hypothetical protein HMPREF0731_2698, partial [Pseudoroseomonas cervicalis ATCC 49957]